MLTGFASSSDCEKTLPAFLPAKSLNEVARKDSEHTKKYRHASANSSFRTTCRSKSRVQRCVKGLDKKKGDRD